MERISLFLFLSFIFLSNSFFADELLWQGDVSSKGTHTPLVKLIPGASYRIVATGTINLGKWMQQDELLANDACFQFGKKVTPVRSDALKNSLNIPICEQGYQSDHVYVSSPFIAAQDGIKFWIYDTDYSDNTGSLHVQVKKIENK